MKKIWSVLGLAGVLIFCSADQDSCNMPQTSTQAQNNQQEQLNAEGNSSVGMPNIKNFREKRLLKQIYEMRDNYSLLTWTYTQDMNGKLHLFCHSFGYPIPYATEYTSPARPAHSYETYEQGNITVPQEDPNGLFSPADAEGTWIMCKDPNSTVVAPVYAEPRVFGVPFCLPSVEDSCKK